MVAIFTGSGTGLERGSANVLGGAGLLGAAVQGRSGNQVFVNAFNGNLVIGQQDEFLVGRGPDVAITRTYNSQGDLSDDNADNWRMGTDRRVYGLTGTVNTVGSTIKRVSADGSVITYSWNATYDDGVVGAYVATDGRGSYDVLRYNIGTNVWTWTDGDSRWTETYEQFVGDTTKWRIKEQADSETVNGLNKISFTYVSATNKLNRATTNDGAYTQYNWSPTSTRNLMLTEIS